MVVALHRIVIMGSYPANQNLRQARQRAGISQAEFAERLGVYMRDHMSSNVSPSGNLVGMWERGEARPGRLYRRGLIEFTGLSETDLGFGSSLLFAGGHLGIGGHPAWNADDPRHAVFAQDLLHDAGGHNVVHGCSWEDGDDPVRRREMLGTAAALAGAAALGKATEGLVAAQRRPAVALEDVLYGRADAAPVSLVALRAAINWARNDFREARYERLPGALPGLVASAQATREHAGVGESAAASELLADAYIVAADFAVKINDDPLAWMTADRALQAAQAGNDPLILADARRAVATAMRRAGHPDRACQLLIRACHDIEPGRHQTPDQLAMYGSLFNVAAYTAATAGNRHAAEDYIAEAATAALRLGTAESSRQPTFGRAGVALYQVSIAQVFGDNGTAIYHARKLRAVDIPTAERRGRYWVDVARAYHQWGKPESCYAALLAAENAAPAEVRYRPPVQRIAEDLLRSQRTAMPGLRAFARRAGLPGV
jgi:transcriptional regulator with XRE-family HTH domain